jgi:hypothetical protein
MILGLTIQQFTLLHVGISLIGIIAGLIAMPAFATGHRLPAATAIFLATTALTTLTGFLFPITVVTPALITGVISTMVIAIALAAIYRFGLRGKAGIVYAVSANVALWLNLFVLVVQAFLKVPALNALAPNGNEPPFAVAQGLVLIGMVGLGWACVRAVRRRAVLA